MVVVESNNTSKSRNWELIKSTGVIVSKLHHRMTHQHFTNIGDTIIIMWHIPKCGGTTINEAMWSQLPEDDIFIFRRTSKYFWSWPSLLKNESLTLTPKKVTFIEFHGESAVSKYYSFVNMSEDIKGIRSNVEAKGGKVFLFTVLRDPIPAVMSYHKYLCYGVKKPPGGACHPNRFHIEDLQINYLAYSYMPFLCRMPTKRLGHGKGDVLSAVISSLKSAADFVGVTEDLSATFHALQEFINDNAPGCKVNLLHYANSQQNSMSNFNSTLKFPEIHKMRMLLRGDIALYEHFNPSTKNESITFPLRNTNGRSLLDQSTPLAIEYNTYMGLINGGYFVVVLMIILITQLSKPFVSKRKVQNKSAHAQQI